MSGIGPEFDREKLARVLRALEKRGVTSIVGEEGERICRAQGARAMYWPAPGGPGTLIFPERPTRREVVEELLHLGQYRNRRWPSSAESPALRFEVEIEAQDRLLDLARRRGWSADEVEDIRRARGAWRAGLEAQEGGRP